MADAKNSENNKPAENKAEQNAEEQSAQPVKEMKAVVLTGFGGLKSVKVMKKPEPTAGAGEVLIRVKACGLNFLDLIVRQGAIDNLPKAPFVMGFECAGVIEALGEGVTEFQIGDHVAALTEYKAWAELAAISANFVYRLPSNMTFQEAATILMNYTVAYTLLFDIGNLKSGQKVLIHSAGGGVGLAVSQLCKTLSDVILIGTASKHKHEAIQNSFTHLLDHTVDYVQEVKKYYCHYQEELYSLDNHYLQRVIDCPLESALSAEKYLGIFQKYDPVVADILFNSPLGYVISPEGVDLVLDCLCGDDANKGYSLLKPLGRYILYGTSSLVSGETKSLFSFAKSWWQVDKVSPMKLFDENKTLSGYHLRHLLYQQGCHDYVRDVVNKVFKMWQEGKIKPVIDSAWAFEDVPEAMQKLHDRKNVGKISLDPTMEPKPKPQAKTGKDKEGKDGKGITSGESTDTDKDAKEEQSPPPSAN